MAPNECHQSTSKAQEGRIAIKTDSEIQELARQACDLNPLAEKAMHALTQQIDRRTKLIKRHNLEIRNLHLKYQADIRTLEKKCGEIPSNSIDAKLNNEIEALRLQVAQLKPTDVSETLYNPE